METKFISYKVKPVVSFMEKIQITALDQRIVTTNSESYITLTINQIVRNVDFKC